MVKCFLGLRRCFSNSKHHRWCENQLNPPEINDLQPLQKHRHLAQSIKDQRRIHSKNYLRRTPCRALTPSLYSYLPQLPIPLENSTSPARPGIQLAAAGRAPNQRAMPQEGIWTCTERAAAPCSWRAGAGRGPSPSSALPDQLGCAGRTGYLCTCSSRQSWEQTFEQHGEVIFWLTLVRVWGGLSWGFYKTNMKIFALNFNTFLHKSSWRLIYA